jgi:hypothetical protein
MSIHCHFGTINSSALSNGCGTVPTKKLRPGLGTPSGDHWPKSGNGFPFDRTFTLFGAYGTTDRNYLGSFCS